MAPPTPAPVSSNATFIPCFSASRRRAVATEDAEGFVFFFASRESGLVHKPTEAHTCDGVNVERSSMSSVPCRSGTS
jgi:hypothetical protein